MNSISYTQQGVYVRSDGDVKNIQDMIKTYLIRGYTYDKIEKFPKYLQVLLTKPV